MKAVILAGGYGSRLWPLSRSNKPKQFQKLVSNKTMLQETIARLDFLKPEDIYISTNEEYGEIVEEQVKNKIPLSNIILEPALRDTAPSIGLAAVYIGARHPDEVMAVIYADHLVQKKDEFKAKLQLAEQLAKEENTLNIIEVKAKFPNVNLGYVKIGKMLKEVDGIEVFAFERFIEKPNLETARSFLQSYKYLWNTGFYVWKISTILEKFEKYLPATYEKLMNIQKAIDTPGSVSEKVELQGGNPFLTAAYRDIREDQKRTHGVSAEESGLAGSEASIKVSNTARRPFQTRSKQKKVLRELYEECDKISIDYGIMEKVDPKEVRIIPAELGWSDIGTWESLFEELASHEHANLVKGKHVSIDTQGSVIYGNKKKLIATVGVKNLVIVETDDALLICAKNRSQDVKKLVEKLKKSHKKLL